jgi:predicted extracellular nuclease
MNGWASTTFSLRPTRFTFDSPPSCLHDRPPYRLDAVFSVGDRPFSVLVNHTRSFRGIGDCRPGQSGERVCRKRLEQAQSIANFVQSFQSTHPGVPLVVVGDHNAYPFTDGHVDVLGIIQGHAKLASDPEPDSQLAPATDIVEPNLTNAVQQIAPEERYSYLFDRALQAIDHALLNVPAQAAFAGFAYGRANVDAPLLFERTADNVLMYGDDIMVSGFDARNERSPVRVSDHDGFVIRLFP